MTDLDQIRVELTAHRKNSNALLLVGYIEALCDEVVKLRAVGEAAKAEVLAQGYRSTDMAKALCALYGEFWFETTPSQPPGD